MNALILTFFAACFAALSNFFFRKNSDGVSQASSYGYLLCFYFLSLLLSFIVFPQVWHTPFNLPMLIIGACVGVANVGVMVFTGQALQRGPAGLTFAFQNVSSLLPGLLLFFLFGPAFGFMFTSMKVFGIFLVLIGLFMGANLNKNGQPLSRSWLIFALSCFAFQALALTLIQWRCLLFGCDENSHMLLPTALNESADAWFMPGQFGAAFLVQGLLFYSEKRSLQSREVLFGSLGGIANGITTCLLLLSTKWAMPLEKTILLPCFAAGTIVLCNFWASRVYKERFNIPSNVACSLGIFLGTMA